MPTEGYCSFKTDQGMYISSKKFKSHAEAAKWVAAEIKARGLLFLEDAAITGSSMVEDNLTSGAKS